VKPIAVLFDLDGTLITTGGAGARSWRDAFQDLDGMPPTSADFTDAGMTDPEVGRLTFVGVIGRDPTVAVGVATATTARRSSASGRGPRARGASEPLPGLAAATVS
jgi:phosphoglycolate phosphatase-like HAD superfamily hydrolase